MKKLLFRKLLIDCLTFFFITLLSASVIIWVFQAVNFLDIMIEDGRSYKVYINYSLLNFPKIVSKVLPFTFFFSFFDLSFPIFKEMLNMGVCVVGGGEDELVFILIEGFLLPIFYKKG